MALGAAPAHANFDVFDNETLTPLDSFGNEVAYAGGATKTFTTPTFSTAGFGLDQGENNAQQPNFNGCAESPPVYGGKTAWARFDPAVNGRIYVDAITPGYDSIVWIREAGQKPWKSTFFSDLVGNFQDCADAVNAAGSEKTQALSARADRAYYVQVGGKCAGGPETCNDPGVPGGNTTISVTFVPDDSDTDGVPDSTDKCSGTPMKTQVNADGCPDEDGDGVKDEDDDCKGLKGEPAADPFNGCPPGPDPPKPGQPASVLIVSKSNNFDYTTSPTVDLQLNWPKGAQKVHIDNQAGDVGEDRELKPVIEWQLRPAQDGIGGARTVQVRFTGPGIDVTPNPDTIELDTAKPRVRKKTLIGSPKNGWTVAVKAGDQGSGVRSIAALDASGKPIETATVCRSTQCGGAATRVFTKLSVKPRRALVTDAAGNARSASLSAFECSSPKTIEAFTVGGDLGCFRHRQRCKPKAYDYKGGNPSVRCDRRGRERSPRVHYPDD